MHEKHTEQRNLTSPQHLRIALIAGTLAQGGAEKQTLYLARSLSQRGANVRVYTLTDGDFYGQQLKEESLPPVWFGQSSLPPVRVATLILKLRQFEPHVVHAIHEFTNPYAAVAAQCVGAISLGGVRGDLAGCRDEYGRLTPWLVRVPHAVAFNSNCSLRQFIDAGLIRSNAGYVLRNAIDLSCYRVASTEDAAGYTTIFIARLIRSKRLDLYLRALALARHREPRLRGVVVGDGPEFESMCQFGTSLGLTPEHVRFVGRTNDIAAVLEGAGILVLTSVSEGCPNVLLEGMAASLPSITTAVGDTSVIIEDGVSGIIANSCEAIADAMVRLARSPNVRRAMGHAARTAVEANYSVTRLADRALEIYADVRLTRMRSRKVAAGGLSC